MTAATRKRRICVVTGTRADYGLLEPLLGALREAPDLELQVIATGMHLSPEFGLTYREIQEDGYEIDARVEMLLSSDSPVGIAKSMGLGVIGMADALARLEPDLLVVLGDRFEILAAAQAAMAARVPIAHIAGGDTTEGAYDEVIRHALTKMAHLHFVTNADARRRVIQLGEAPARVHLVGSPGIDKLLATARPDRETLEAELGVRLRPRTLLVTFHPVTLETGESLGHLEELLAALATLEDDVGFVFTGSNADNEGRRLMDEMRAFAERHPGRAHVFTSLGSRRYLGLLEIADAVVGNSSSGLYEAPSLGTPTVNVGDRQKGRLRAASVVDVPSERRAIAEGIRRALSGRLPSDGNPYGDGRATERIMAVLRGLDDVEALLRKPFHDAALAEGPS